MIGLFSAYASCGGRNHLLLTWTGWLLGRFNTLGGSARPTEGNKMHWLEALKSTVMFAALIGFATAILAGLSYALILGQV